jgi:hypothetical protein
MSEQRHEAAAAVADRLRTELAEHGAMIAHLREELQQKEHLLQQISMAAAPVAATNLPMTLSPKRPTTNKITRIPGHTPGRILEAPKTMHFAQHPALVSVHAPPEFAAASR